MKKTMPMPACTTRCETPDRQRRRVLAGLSAAVAGVALAAPGGVFAQAERTVKMIVGFPPGSGPDVLARTLAQALNAPLKAQVVVDNRPGAGGQIGAQAVAKAPGDGATLLLAELGSIAIAPPAFTKLPYDPARELSGLGEVARADFVLVVPATSPARSVADFVKAAKDRGDRTNMGTFGAGTPGHFGAELFAEQGGFKIEPVHYRATGDAVTAIIAGDVSGAFVSTALAAAQIKGGKMRGLATTAPQRSALLPDVPTFSEAGYPKTDFSSWFVVFLPASAPEALQASTAAALAAAMGSAELRAKLQEAGFSVTGTSRADTQAMLKREAVRWDGIVKASGFKGD